MVDWVDIWVADWRRNANEEVTDRLGKRATKAPTLAREYDGPWDLFKVTYAKEA